MLQIKIFNSVRGERDEASINKWLAKNSDNRIIDIKVIERQTSFVLDIVILYEVLSEKELLQ